MKWAKRLLIFGLLAAFLLPACGEEEESSYWSITIEGEIYMGMLVPFSGSWSVFGQSNQQAIRQAIEEINEGGGIDGKTLGLLTANSTGDPTTAKHALDELVEKWSVGAVSGGARSLVSTALIPEAKKHKIVLISSGSTSPALSTADDDGYFFRTCNSDTVQGVAAAGIAEEQQFEKVFVINIDDAYGNGLRSVFVDKFSGQADYATYKEEDENYAQTVIQAAKEYKPDAVFLIAFVDDGAAILKEAATTAWDGDTPKWILPDGPKDQELVTKVGNNAFLEGVLGTSPIGPAGVGQAGQDFLTTYRQLWSTEPGVFNIQSYDVPYLLAIAMMLSEDPTNGTQIRDNLSQAQVGNVFRMRQWQEISAELKTAGQVNYEGLSGPVDFDQHGDVLGNIAQWTIKSGVIQDVGCWTPEGASCE